MPTELFPIALNVPRLIADTLVRSIKNRDSRDQALAHLVRLQEEAEVMCPACGKHAPFPFPGEEHAGRLYDLCKKLDSPKFFDEVTRRYASLRFVCGNCGSDGRLPATS